MLCIQQPIISLRNTRVCANTHTHTRKHAHAHAQTTALSLSLIAFGRKAGGKREQKRRCSPKTLASLRSEPMSLSVLEAQNNSMSGLSGLFCEHNKVMRERERKRKKTNKTKTQAVIARRRVNHTRLHSQRKRGSGEK